MRITLLMLVTLLVLSVGVSAQDFEFVGGITYSTFGLSELNEAIDDMNSFLDYAKDNDGSAEISKLDNVKSAIGFYAGLNKEINEELIVGGQFEKYSLGTEGSLKTSLEGGIDEDIKYKLDISGLVGTAAYKVNENLALNGGIGYYSGKSTYELKGTDDEKQAVDINGIGFKVGASYNYELKPNVSFIGSANYRSVTLKEKDDKVICMIELPEDYDNHEIKELNAGGFEISGGIAYSF